MQLIPETSARFKVKKPFDSAQNVHGGLAYLRWLLAYFRGDVKLVVAAYNAGERAVERYRGVPPYAETRALRRPDPQDLPLRHPSLRRQRNGAVARTGAERAGSHTMSVSVRRLVPADAADFQALRLRGLTECPTAFASSLAEERDTAPAAIAQHLAPAPDGAVLGAFDAATLAGMVGVKREHHVKLAHKAFLWGMYVAPEHRRRRVGRLLVDAALAQAYAMPGVTRVNLGVNVANAAAIALYEGAGFTRFGLERDFMRVDGAPQDELHMVHVCAAG